MTGFAAVTCLAPSPQAGEKVLRGEIIHRGFVSCFPATEARAAPASDAPQSCEISAAAWDAKSGSLYLGNDKHTYAAPVTCYGFKPPNPELNLIKVRDLTDPLLRSTIKYEDMAFAVGLSAGRGSPANRYVIATTSLSMPPVKGRDDARYVRLIYWPLTGDTPCALSSAGAAMLARQRDASPEPGLALRGKLVEAANAALNPPKNKPWHSVKIEGLAVVPGHGWCRPLCLLFGVRSVWRYKKSENGKKEETDDDSEVFTFLILGQALAEEDGRLYLTDAPQPIYRMPNKRWRRELVTAPPFKKMAEQEAATQDKKKKGKLREALRRVGISGLAYDAAAQRLFILTSYEKDGARKPGDIAAFLWSLPLEDLWAKRPARLVRSAKDGPLAFRHKAEAVTVIDGRTLLVVHDDDRVRLCDKIGAATLCRRPDQSPYAIVRLR